MYLAAQHVRSSSGREGINAFCHMHGSYVWLGAPPEEFLPENNPGMLVAKHIDVPPPGNSVRSYLDIIAPDEMSTEHLFSNVRRFLSTPPLRLPCALVVEDCLFRFNLEQGLMPNWRNELVNLARHALQVRRAV